MEPCKVVNIKAYPERKLPANVAYCGRLSKNDPGPYGNPYEIGRDGTRDEVCDKWDIELKLRLQDPAYEARMMRDLDGKDLACFCFPLRCHCQSTLREVGDRSQFPDRYPQFQRANERDRRAILITEDKPSTQESAPPQGRRLGIIGTAGRKDDRPRMSTALQVRMGDAARAVVQAKEFNRLVSWRRRLGRPRGCAARTGRDGQTVQPDATPAGKTRTHGI
jgi:hypothetical protein